MVTSSRAGQRWEAWWSTVPSISSFRRREGTGMRFIVAGPGEPAPVLILSRAFSGDYHRLPGGKHLGARGEQGHRDVRGAAQGAAGGDRAPAVLAAGTGPARQDHAARPPGLGKRADRGRAGLRSGYGADLAAPV